MLDRLTLDQMRTFVAVAESGSFRSGAARLSRVQSAASSSIANLEQELGVGLFDRSGHRPVLTSEGRALLANARDILLRVDVMRARARALAEDVELEFALTVDTLFPIAAAGAALNKVRASYPSVSIRVSIEPLGGPISALIEKRCTIAILVGEDFRDPKVTLEAIMSVEQVAVVSAQHPLAVAEGKDITSLLDLADHLQIVLSDPTTRSEGRQFGVLSPHTCRVDSQDTKHAMILSGIGWGRLPLWVVDRDLREGRLMRLNAPSLGREGRVITESYLAYRLDEPLGVVSRLFRHSLTDMLQKSYPPSGQV